MSFDPVNLTQTARLYIHTIHEIVIDADGPNAAAAEQATRVLNDLDALETMLKERRKALRKEIKQVQEVKVTA